MAAAPAPTMEVNAQWRGLLLLGNMHAEEELAVLIAAVVPRLVDVFHLKGGDPGFGDLARDMNRMVDLYGEFLRMPALGSTEKGRAEKEINALKTAARETASAWGAAPKGQTVPLHIAKAATTQIGRFLHSMILLTDIMEAQQRKIVLQRILQAAQSVQLLREAHSPDTLARHAPIFNSHFDALYNVLGVRIEALQQMGEQIHRMKTAQIMEGVQYARYKLYSAMEGFVCEPNNLDCGTEVEQEVQRVSRSLEELVALMTAGVKAQGGINHNLFDRSLDALAEAVDAQSPAGVSAAARELVQEVKRHDAKSVEGVALGEDGTGPLRDAADRLRDRLQELLAATKANLNQPSSEHREEFERNLELVKREVEYDSISTTLASSGMIDAAAQVSAQLNALFTI